MQICSRCHTSDNPDTAKTCYKCGGSPLRRYKRRYLGLRRSDLVTPASIFPQTRGVVDTPVATPALICAIILLFSFIILFFPFTSSSPQLTVSDSAMQFDQQDLGQRQTRTFTIRNTGTAPLHWTTHLPPDARRWLTLQPLSSSLSANDKQVETVTIDTTGLASGPYSAKLQINSDGGSNFVDITMTVVQNQPSLSVAPTSLAFQSVIQGTSSTQRLHLINTGKQPLPWSIKPSSLPSWLSLFPGPTGNLPSLQSEDIDVTIKTSQFPAGTSSHQAHLTFLYNKNGAVTIPIQATVVPRPAVPHLCINPTIIDLGVLPAGQTGTQRLELSNCGTGTLRQWSTSPTAPWLTVTPSASADALLPGYSQLIMLHYNTQGFREGSYQESLTFQSNTNSIPVTVKLATHVPHAILCNVTQQFNFGTLLPDTNDTQSLQIQNCGDLPLTWGSSSQLPSWLYPSSSHGILAPHQAATIQFQVSTAHLSPAPYPTTVHLASDGGDADIAITMQVIRPADLSHNELDFGVLTQGGSKSRLLPIGNTGDVALTWRITSYSASWVQASSQSGTIPAHQSQEIPVTAQSSSLTPNQQYKATITFTYNGGKTANVPVYVDVLAPLRLCTMPSPPDPIMLQQGQPVDSSFGVYNCGSGTLLWDIKTFSLHRTDGTGDFTPFASVQKQGDGVALHINATDNPVLPAGSYTLSITFSDPNTSSVDIAVTVTQPPRLCTSPSPPAPITVAQSKIAESSFLVYNCGGGTLIWHVASATTTLQESESSVTLPTSFMQYDDGIGIAVDATTHGEGSLPPVGSYTLTITFQESNLQSIDITVNVTSPPPPELCTELIEPTSTPVPVPLGSSTTATLRVYNCEDGGIFPWNVTSVIPQPEQLGNDITLLTPYSTDNDHVYITIEAQQQFYSPSYGNTLRLRQLASIPPRPGNIPSQISSTVTVNFSYNNGKNTYSTSFEVEVTGIPTPTPTDTSTPTPDTATPTPTDTPTDVPTDTPTPTDTPIVVPTDTATPTDTPPDVPTDTPTLTPAPQPSPTP